jgi:hypothetical protein
MNLTTDLNASSKEKQQYGADVAGSQDIFATDGNADFSDVFLLGGNTWDFNNCSMIPENYFNPKMFDEAEDALAVHSPKALKAGEGHAVPTSSPMKTEAARAEIKAPIASVTKAAANIGNGRRRSGGPANGAASQNWYNICQQPNTAPVQTFPPSGLAYAQTSPYLEWGATATSPGLMSAADPYAWMSGRPKRSASFGFPMASPPMLYQQNGFPQMGMFGAAGPQSPQFGFVNPMFMVSQPAPKLPVQALPPRAEAPAAESRGGAGVMMAPLVLPVDLGKRKAAPADPEIDPTAISNAISAALSRKTDEAGCSPSSSASSMSASGIPAAASQLDNMRLYESTFQSFVKEEAAIDYDNVTVIELKKLLRKYHLAATGKKDELIQLVQDVAKFLKGTPPKAEAIAEAEIEAGGKGKGKERKIEEVPKKLAAEDKPKDFSQFFEMS